MRTLTVVGTRPNFVKMAPVLAALRARLPAGEHRLVHTGQHYDAIMSEAFLADLGIGEPDHRLQAGSGSQAAQTARVMERLEPVVETERPDLLLVGGDVNSTLAAALVAVKLGVPLAHVEAGLRSFDLTMPEEANRIVADRFAELLFIHSEEATANLTAEGLAADRIHAVGNTMIDALVAAEPRFRAARAASHLGLSEGSYLLVTLHRPALVDGPLLGEAMESLASVAAELPVVFPVHPRTRARLDGLPSAGAVRCVGPVGYLDFLSLEADAAAVLTDSGGVQEETTYLSVPCFTLRANTERPVTVRAGTNTLLGLDPARITEIPGLLAATRPAHAPPPGWDGHAGQRAAEVVAAWLER